RPAAAEAERDHGQHAERVQLGMELTDLETGRRTLQALEVGVRRRTESFRLPPDAAVQLADDVRAEDVPVPDRREHVAEVVLRVEVAPLLGSGRNLRAGLHGREGI